jgi:hypothetical protein
VFSGPKSSAPKSQRFGWQQQKDMEILTAQLKEQSAQIQEISADVETSRAALRVVSKR